MFQKARLKLTAWYLLIIMSISFSFSFVIYKALTNEVQRFARTQRYRIEHRTQNNPFPLHDELKDLPAPPRITDPDLINEVKQRLLLMLAKINLGILIITGGLGYFLAGKTLRPIAQMVGEQNRFISDASHELRTPLTGLKTSMEVNLRDKNLTLANAKKIIANSIDQVNKLQSLSDNLLELAQYQNTNNHKYFKTVSLKKIINDVIEKMTPLAEKKQIVIKKKLIETEIKASKDSLDNLFTILLDNAIKYSPNKSLINVVLQKNDKSVTVLVEDKGIGIDAKDLLHIFDRFYRADSARTKTQIDGYGLGLSIAKKIVDDHNGSITVKSKLKQGTTFQLVFSINK